MARQSVDVTDTQLAMLQVLWERGEATRRDVTDALYPGGGQAHYATVQKLLERLEERGFVRHVRRGGVLVYTATVGRDELISRRLRDVADKLCGGAVTPLVMTLVRSQPLSADELRELSEFLDEQKRLRGRPRERSSRSRSE
jgi:predicted transcriptional regulator